MGGQARCEFLRHQGGERQASVCVCVLKEESADELSRMLHGQVIDL